MNRETEFTSADAAQLAAEVAELRKLVAHKELKIQSQAEEIALLKELHHKRKIIVPPPFRVTQ